MQELELEAIDNMEWMTSLRDSYPLIFPDIPNLILSIRLLCKK